MNKTTKAERERLLTEAVRLIRSGLEPLQVAHRLRQEQKISWNRAQRYAYKALRRLRYEEMQQE